VVRIHTAFIILRMVVTKCWNMRFTMVRLSEVTLTDFQVGVPLGILVDCQCHINYDLSIDLVVLAI
jgi:hypothetical protein